LPKPQGLVAGAGDDRLPVGAHREVEHARAVAGQRRDLGHFLRFPHDNLVLGVPVRGHQFVAVLGPGQKGKRRQGNPRETHLTARVVGRQSGADRRVPQAYVLVGGPAAAGEDALLVRAPGDGLHRGGVLVEQVERVRADAVPHDELVVVAARGQLVVGHVPLQPADLLAVRRQGRDRRLRRPRVPVYDVAVPRPGSQDVVVPRQVSHPLGVTLHHPDPFSPQGVVDVHQPVNRRDLVWAEIAEIYDLKSIGRARVSLHPGVTHAAGLGAPKIDAAVEPDGKNVAGRPVDQVQ
ncbi:MAG: hypothetical protein BJ554DRAFT_6597, partial [Olpidium bornovanus]